MTDGFFSRAGVDVYVPSGGAESTAWRSVTHLGIGAHADDLEFMAYHGIEQCRRGGGGFGGVVVTDGAGSVRPKGMTIDELKLRRQEEQRAAAEIGGYSIIAQLGLGSEEIKNTDSKTLVNDLARIFEVAWPQVVYTHNPTDRHETHVAVSLAVIDALRALPKDRRPQRVYGCEGWRDLDWLTDDDRVRLDCGTDEAFATRLNEVFRTQMAGGKRYDLAVIGRRRAHATFDQPRQSDDAEMVTLAMNLTPLIAVPAEDVADFIGAKLDRFREDVVRGIKRFGG